jgi:hypothetical protein
MVSYANQNTRSRLENQGFSSIVPETNKIGAPTYYDFTAHNLTAYGGPLPVTTMLEKPGFQQLVEETLSIQRKTRSMPVFGSLLGMILARYMGFPASIVCAFSSAGRC